MTGIDPAEGQLAFARTRPGAKLAQFQTGSAQDLPFANGAFDAALMALVISLTMLQFKYAEKKVTYR